MKPKYKSAVAQVNCASEKGTAFLVEAQKAITARHTIEDYWEGSKIYLCFPNYNKELTFEAKVIYPSEPYLGIDMAILELSKPINDIIPLTLCTSIVEPNGNWSAYGYSTTKRDNGEMFYGTITQIFSHNMDEGKYDLDLACSHPQIIDTKYNTKGASGSPIFRDEEVIGILSDKVPGGTIGGVSIISCLSILKDELNLLKYLKFPSENVKLVKTSKKSIHSNVTVKNVVLTSLQHKIVQARETALDLIQDFPSDTHSMLYQVLDDLINELLSINSSILENYLHLYKFPFSFNHDNDIGIEQLIEILTLIKLQFPNIKLVHNDQTANLLIDDQLDLFINLIYAVKRHTKMPEIILEMVRKIIQTPTGRKAVDRGEQILPYPLIIDNCSGNRKVNLCRNCQSEFSFDNIVKDFCSEDDDGYFVGIEQNNFGLLQETKVLCANCIRNLHNEVIDLNELLQRIKELIA